MGKLEHMMGSCLRRFVLGISTECAIGVLAFLRNHLHHRLKSVLLNIESVNVQATRGARDGRRHVCGYGTLNFTLGVPYIR